MEIKLQIKFAIILFIKNLIYLDIFIHRLEKNSSVNKEKYILFNLFGNDQIGDVATALDAANVLKAVMLGNAKYSMLERYKNELSTNNELGSIYKKVLKYLITDSSASLLSNAKVPEISKMSLQ